MLKIVKIFISFFILLFIIFTVFTSNKSTLAYTDNNSIHVDLGVSGCNNNGICESGETITSCPSDCTPTPPPPATPGGGGGHLPVEIIDITNLKIVTDYTNATITWNSSLGTISTIHWGKTEEVSEGTSSNILFLINHKIQLTDLNPGTMYFFTIESRTARGTVSINPPVYFFTKFLKDTSLPSNPTNVKAVATVSGILLSWQNPPDENFSYIRIMRHEDHFYGDPFLGKLIYEGPKEKFLDQKVIAGKKYFYTLFSRTTEGDFSSGVAVSATAYSRENIPEEKPGEKPTEKPVEKPVENLPKIIIPENFFVHQYNQQVSPLIDENKIQIDSEKGTVIDINSKTLADDLLKVTDENGNLVGQYLFSFNKDSGRYQSVIPPLKNPGTYNLKIYRYKENILYNLGQGVIVVQNTESQIINKNTQNSILNNFYIYLSANYYLIFIIIALIILIITAYFLFRNKKEKTANPPENPNN